MTRMSGFTLIFLVLIWKEQPVVCAGTPPTYWGIVVVNDADLFGGDLEPCGVFLPIIMNRAIAIGCADPVGFFLRLRIRDHVADLFAGVYLNAIADQIGYVITNAKAK